MAVSRQPGPVGPGPDAEQLLLGATDGAHGRAQEDLATVLALYRQNLASSGGDRVLAVGLVEATLTQDRISHARTTRALVAAAARLVRLETEVTRLIGGRA